MAAIAMKDFHGWTATQKGSVGHGAERGIWIPEQQGPALEADDE